MRYLATFLTVLLLALPIMGQEDSSNPKAGYVGFAWDDNKPNYAMGFAFNIYGDLWNFDGLLYKASEQTASVEVAYLLDLNDITSLFGFLDKPIWTVPTKLQKLRFGPVAGPNADWESDPDGATAPVMRVLGAAGFIAHYPLGEAMGVWAFYKHKFSLKESAFLDRNTFAAGFSYQL